MDSVEQQQIGVKIEWREYVRDYHNSLSSKYILALGAFLIQVPENEIDEALLKLLWNVRGSLHKFEHPNRD